MRLTFLGTGLMGRPMAERLLDAGHEVTVWNRTAEKAESLVERGATFAPDAAHAVEASEATLLMLADAPAIEAVLFADRAPDLAERTVVQMGTIGSDESRQLARRVEAAGGTYLEAPVLGSRPQAAAGKLLVLVGGDEALFRRWEPILAALGMPRLIGPVGAAAALKLAFNQLIAVQGAAFATAIGMVRSAGLDLDRFLEILRESAFHAKSFDAKLPSIRTRDFRETNFPARLLLKDVDLVLRECRDRGLDTSAVEGVRTLVQKTVDAGHGDDDYAAITLGVEGEDE